MAEHDKCLHIVDFANMEKDIQFIRESQRRMEKKQLEVLGIIFGNGGKGLKTKIAVNSYAIGVIVTGISALAAYIFYGGG